MQTYTFRRWALNRSNSKRMAKIGKPFTGSLNDAINYARELGKTEGEVFVFQDDTKVAEVTEFRNLYLNEPGPWIQIRVLSKFLEKI